MARTGMSSVIQRLRVLADAGTADYTIGGVTHWTDDQIEAVADRYRRDFRLPMTSRSSYVSEGSAEYTNYYFQTGDWFMVEEATTGTDAWRVESATGAEIGTADYTANYASGHLSFSADQGGSVYYLRGRRFDIYRAASDLCKQKAASYAADFDLKTDNHDMKRSQKVAHFSALARDYLTKSPARQARLVRNDVNV